MHGETVKFELILLQYKPQEKKMKYISVRQFSQTKFYQIYSAVTCKSNQNNPFFTIICENCPVN